jgi:UDP-N-acetylglucosamine 2-epimerase (non-hydrolysing)
MKIAPLQRLMEESDKIKPILLHTGQHYDEKMSKLFFVDLEMPQPDIYLGVGSGTHAEQTAKIMVEFEKVCFEEKPDLVLVVGDVNSTAACSLVAKKLHIDVAHVEAGLRSGDRDMPEEINRLVTDAISDHLFTTEKSGTEHLQREGIAPEKIHFVGNVMIDSLTRNLERSDKSGILNKLGLEKGNYILITLHRPSNVDDPEMLAKLVELFAEIEKEIPLVFPIHPRTKKTMEKFGLMEKINGMRQMHLLEPQGYLDFLQLMKSSKAALTDSGGIQEETTYLGIPCITMRDNTERPVTAELGTNVVAGRNVDYIRKLIKKLLEGEWKEHRVPPLWDGKAAERIIAILEEMA